ncbi:MAG: NAD(P)/FAD-dependent oxidoreductase [Hyphomonadaceae bacterium]
MSNADVDVLIVGAGLSGIGAAVHLQNDCPDKTYTILEGRDAIGGTWDLFRYPGIRSDSDMFTLGYVFKPWTEAKAIADGPNIRKYVRETATEHGIEEHIRFGHRVVSASWSSANGLWTITAQEGETTHELTCRFLFMCSGYYNYEAGYTPEFEGVDEFKGEIAHPQKWTSDIDYQDKKVVVIGSGATAVTLVPEMSKSAAHVTMLQRSPTYMVSRPSRDWFANLARKILPADWAYSVSRWKNIKLGRFFYDRTQSHPQNVKRRLLGEVRKHLGDGFDIQKDFTPSYNPWEQRLCLVPDGDLFKSLKSGDASIVTDHIDRFVPEGIKLQSGKILEADLVVTATGLELQIFGGMSVSVDGKDMQPGDLLTYKGLMYRDVPNFANIFGYTNASWTLKADLTSHYVCRLINHLDETGADFCVPRATDSGAELKDMVPLSSGYFARAIDRMPKEGVSEPWQQLHDYTADIKALKLASLEDGSLMFEHRSDTAHHKGVAAE